MSNIGCHSSNLFVVKKNDVEVNVSLLEKYHLNINIIFKRQSHSLNEK